MHTPAHGVARRRVGLVTGCVQSVFFADVNAATARVLALDGCDVLAPAGQECCGALELHAGRDGSARARARRLIAEFEPLDLDTVVVNAAGCGSTLKECGALLAGDPQWAARAGKFAAKVRDVTEVIAELGASAPRDELRVRVAYHDACHLSHAQGVRDEPRAALAAVPGVELVSVPEGDLCCGSAGIYNLVEPEAAEELGRRMAGNLAATSPDLVVTANPGCLLQIRRYLPDVPVLHPVEIIDHAIVGTDPRTDRRQGSIPSYR